MKFFKDMTRFFMCLWFIVAIFWVGNLVKLVNCDFEAPYTEEVIHSIGLIPYVSFITVWMDADK